LAGNIVQAIREGFGRCTYEEVSSCDPGGGAVPVGAHDPTVEGGLKLHGPNVRITLGGLTVRGPRDLMLRFKHADHIDDCADVRQMDSPSWQGIG
jgi:hypothetical protein